MEKISRRKFMELAAAGMGAAALGIGAENQAQAEPLTEQKEMKKDWERIIAKILKEELFWANNPEYADSEIVKGEEQIEQKILEEIRQKKPKIFIFGEIHRDAFCEYLLYNLLDKNSTIKGIAEEAVEWEKDEESNEGLLSTTSFENKESGYRQKINNLIDSRHITRALLQHPKDAARERDAKIIPLSKKGQVYVIVGSSHAFLAPGERTGEDDVIILKIEDKRGIISMPQTQYFYDEFKSLGTIAIKYIPTEEYVRTARLRILEEILPAMREGADFQRILKAVKEQTKKFIANIKNDSPALIYQPDKQNATGIILSPEDGSTFKELQPEAMEMFFSFPEVQTRLKDKKYTVEVGQSGLIFELPDGSGVVISQFDTSYGENKGARIISMDYFKREGAGEHSARISKKTEYFKTEFKDSQWRYEKTESF